MSRRDPFWGWIETQHERDDCAGELARYLHRSWRKARPRTLTRRQVDEFMALVDCARRIWRREAS